MTDGRVNRHPGNNLDLLRLVFASLVILSHASELIDGDRHREPLSIFTHNVQSFGEFAVHGFFALSGYLIMASWTRRSSMANYLKNRALRIYPAFIIAFCISVLIIGPWGANGMPYFQQIAPWDFIVGMLTLREPLFVKSFPGLPYHAVNGALWSISYEFLCYLAVAVIGILSGRFLRLVWLSVTLILVIASCFLYEMHSLPAIGGIYLETMVRIGSVFFAGATIYLIGFKGFNSVLPIFAFALLVLASAFSWRFKVAGFALFGSIFFLSIGLGFRRISFTRRWPDISYGTYLYGWPVLQMVIWLIPGLNPWSVFALSLGISLLFGYLSWTLIEAPFMNLKSPMRRS